MRLTDDPVFMVRVTQAALNPCPDTLLGLAVHCEVMASLALHEGDYAAWQVYDRETEDWLHAYRCWKSPGEAV